MMIGMVEDHMVRFSEHPAADRLLSVDLTPAGFMRLKKGVETQRIRESAIPEEDVAAAVQFAVDHPDVGAGKARVSLIDKEAAYLSTVSLNQMKQTLKEMVSQEYQQRKEAEKLLEAQLRKNLLDRRSEYHHFQAQYPDHIWAMDFSQIIFLGIPFNLCDAYDEYSQSYRALKVGLYADHELAVSTFDEALSNSNKNPEYVRRDNGSAFETENFRRCLGEKIEDYPIPPGSPWLNGSLESCHTSLKAAVKTTAMQDMAETPNSFHEARRDPSKALALLQVIVDRVLVMVNEDISRLKHGMPPGKIYAGEKYAVKRRHQSFVEKKKLERRERMEAIRGKPAETRTRRTYVDKVKSVAKKVIDKMETNALYVLNEALHRRYKLCET